MFAGMQMTEVEAALSTALTASLHVPAHARTEFVAAMLVAIADKAPTPAVPEAPSTKPPGLDDEIAELNELVRNAVNCAARHSDDPLRRIADHLLRQGRQASGLRLPGDEDPVVLVAPAAADASTSVPDSPSVEAPQAVNPMQKALEARRVGRDVPVVDKGAVSGGSVIGALQREAANRAAREIDENIVAQGMKAGIKAAGVEG